MPELLEQVRKTNPRRKGPDSPVPRRTAGAGRPDRLRTHRRRSHPPRQRRCCRSSGEAIDERAEQRLKPLRAPGSPARQSATRRFPSGSRTAVEPAAGTCSTVVPELAAPKRRTRERRRCNAMSPALSNAAAARGGRERCISSSLRVLSTFSDVHRNSDFAARRLSEPLPGRFAQPEESALLASGFARGGTSRGGRKNHSPSTTPRARCPGADHPGGGGCCLSRRTARHTQYTRRCALGGPNQGATPDLVDPRGRREPVPRVQSEPAFRGSGRAGHRRGLGAPAPWPALLRGRDASVARRRRHPRQHSPVAG